MGDQYYLAEDRAKAAEAEADRIAADIPAAEHALRDAQVRLDTLRAEPQTEGAAEPTAGSDRVVAAARALAAFDASRTARAAELVAANPLREVIDHTSLANRLSALRSLAEQDAAFLLSVVAVKLFAFALEMLAIIAAHVMSRSEYHLLRGRLLANAGRIARNAYRQSHMDESTLRTAFRKQAWDEARDEMAGDIFFRSMTVAKTNEPVGG